MELKIRVKSEEENREVQNLFFKLGGSWGFGGTRIRYESEKYLYLRDTTITYGESDWWFNENSCKETTLSELRLMVKNKELKEKIDSYESKIETVEEEVLKTDVWYKCIDDNVNNSYLVYRTSDHFNVGFCSDEYREDLDCFIPKNWEKADLDEVKEILIKECKNRGIWDVPVISAEDEAIGDCELYGEEYNETSNQLWSKYEVIWDKGVFAKPISKKLTLEERVERLEKLNNL